MKFLVLQITLSNQTEEYVKTYVIWDLLLILRQEIALQTALRIIIKMTTIANVKHHARVQSMQTKYRDNVLLIVPTNPI